MKKVLTFSARDGLPGKEDVLAAEGMSGPGRTTPETDRLVAQAQERFLALARPASIVASITEMEFAEVFAGEGKNAQDAVLGRIFPAADRLALFACTVGAALTDEIRRLFAGHDYALAYVLDATASAAAEHLADLVQQDYTSTIPHAENNSSHLTSNVVLRYSPGYCGWDISGQRRLFDFLGPEEIGITLRESFLMEPLKSVSGVFVAAPSQAHRFEPGFGFCAACRTQSCRERMLRMGVGNGE